MLKSTKIQNWNMLRVLTFTVVALLLVLCGSIRGDEETKRPHIIFILGNKNID